MFARLLQIGCIATVFGWCGSAFAQSDDPGYVDEHGRRVPTRIVPPKPAQTPHARPAQDTTDDAGDESASEPAPPPTKEDPAKRAWRRYYGDLSPYRLPVREYGFGGRTQYRSRFDEPRMAFVLPHGVALDPWGIQAAMDDAYWAGRYEEAYVGPRYRGEVQMAQRGERILKKQNQVLEAALDQLKRGEYNRAVAGLTMAARLDQGDPASRIHLAQARLALGHYEEAAGALRRALQLQPKLVYADLHLDQYYPPDAALATHGDALRTWLKDHEVEGPVSFLEGFVELQRGDFARSHRAFRRAAELLPDDDLTREYLEISKPAARTTAAAKPAR